MPIHYIKTCKSYRLIIWKASEGLDLLYQSSGLSKDQLHKISLYKEHRQREMLGTQVALNALMCELVTFKKDSYGKPIMDKFPDLNLSLSHSDQYTAVLVSQYRSGLDIQIEREKIVKIAPKFLYNHELDHPNTELTSQLHFYWGIKECVFKAWGKGKVAFREMITVKKFSVLNESVNTSAKFDNGDRKLYFDVHGKKLDNLYLSLVLESI